MPQPLKIATFRPKTMGSPPVATTSPTLLEIHRVTPLPTKTPQNHASTLKIATFNLSDMLSPRVTTNSPARHETHRVTPRHPKTHRNHASTPKNRHFSPENHGFATGHHEFIHSPRNSPVHFMTCRNTLEPCINLYKASVF